MDKMKPLKGIINEEKTLDRLEELYEYSQRFPEENILSAAVLHEIAYLESLL